MPRFAANLSWLYNKYPFEARFAAAARDGFHAVECLFPDDPSPVRLAALLREHGLALVLFNAPPGDWTAGERGLAGLPGRQDEFQDSILRALETAGTLGCPRVHVMAGLLGESIDRRRQWDLYLENLSWAAGTAGAAGVELLIEALNPHDVPRYLLQRQFDAHQAVAAIGSPHLRVQMDLYHCALTESDDVAELLRQHLPGGRVAHLQVAGVPGRHEPDTRDPAVAGLFTLIDALGFDGWIGCEYRPAGGTSAGLDWLRRLARRVPVTTPPAPL